MTQISLPFQVASQRAALSLAFLNGVSFSHQLTALSMAGQNYLSLDDLAPGGAAAVILVSNCNSSGRDSNLRRLSLAVVRNEK